MDNDLIIHSRGLSVPVLALGPGPVLIGSGVGY